MHLKRARRPKAGLHLQVAQSHPACLLLKSRRRAIFGPWLKHG